MQEGLTQFLVCSIRASVSLYLPLAVSPMSHFLSAGRRFVPVVLANQVEGIQIGGSKAADSASSKRAVAMLEWLRAVPLIALTVFMGAWPARAMNVRDILYLNKYGDDMSDVSWCNDQSFAFVTRGPERTAPSVFPPRYLQPTTINMFSIETQQVRPVLVSEQGEFKVDCVRNGGYLYLKGWIGTAMSKGARTPAGVAFEEFFDVRPGSSADGRTSFLIIPQNVVLAGPLRTAPDGSVYAQSLGDTADLDSIVPSKRAAMIENGSAYSLTRNGAKATVVTAGRNRPPSEQFSVYGFTVPEVWGIGSYDCSTNRPGCKAGLSHAPSGYYLYSKFNTDRARLDVVFTFVPGRNPSLQRWSVIGRPGMAWNTLVISGVALDAKHCYVLLEPNPTLAVNRTGGRLRLDLYLAPCRFLENQLQFDDPRPVGKKQASFIWPTLHLHGEFAVITETLDLPSQEDDQIELEKPASSQPNVCARFYRTDSWPVTPVNTICGRLIKDGANALKVSPDGGYVHVRSNSNSLIVGREYRNNGDGPAWLNHGERP